MSALFSHGECVKFLIESRGTTYASFAKTMGISAKTLHRRIEGQSVFSINELTTITSECGVPLASILEGAIEAESNPYARYIPSIYRDNATSCYGHYGSFLKAIGRKKIDEFCYQEHFNPLTLIDKNLKFSTNFLYRLQQFAFRSPVERQKLRGIAQIAGNNLNQQIKRSLDDSCNRTHAEKVIGALAVVDRENVKWTVEDRRSFGTKLHVGIEVVSNVDKSIFQNNDMILGNTIDLWMEEFSAAATNTSAALIERSENKWLLELTGSGL